MLVKINKLFTERADVKQMYDAFFKSLIQMPDVNNLPILFRRKLVEFCKQYHHDLGYTEYSECLEAIKKSLQPENKQTLNGSPIASSTSTASSISPVSPVSPVSPISPISPVSVSAWITPIFLNHCDNHNALNDVYQDAMDVDNDADKDPMDVDDEGEKRHFHDPMQICI